MTLDVIEARNTACQDGFAEVPAANEDGTVYAAFLHDWNGTPRLVVVRDDNWGIGGSPFTALKAPSDLVDGRFVTAGLTLPSGKMGQSRLGASNVSIAVNPGNSDRVYVAYGDSGGFNSETIHVRRSIDRGQNWSNDLLTVTNAMNPEVAINDIGIVGVLYQSVVAGKWETRFVISKTPAATTFGTSTLLASQSAATPAFTYWPYIGDYASLVAADNSFVGMFSASNYPDKANFMNGVQYQREVNWTTHKLYTNAAHTVEVPPSIDPFFFEIGTNVCNISRAFCNICEFRPIACYPIYDPLWWLKSPQCGINIYINPGDEFQQIAVFDSLGKEVGRFERLQQPIVEKGMKFTYGVKLKLHEGVGYVLKTEPVAGLLNARAGKDLASLVVVAPHEPEMVGHGSGRRDVVGNHNDGVQLVEAGNLVDQLADFGFHHHIQAGEGFVHEQEMLAAKKLLGYGNPLPLTARNLCRIKLRAIFHVQPAQIGHDFLIRGLVALFALLGRHHQVAEDGAVLKQRIGLGHNPNHAGLDGSQHGVDQDLPRGRLMQPGNDAK